MSKANEFTVRLPNYDTTFAPVIQIQLANEVIVMTVRNEEDIQTLFRLAQETLNSGKPI